MRIFKRGKLEVRTVQERGSAIVRARVQLNVSHHKPIEGEYEDLGYYEALELGTALMGFGMSRNPDNHLADVMADLQALMRKHTGKGVDFAPFLTKPTDQEPH